MTPKQQLIYIAIAVIISGLSLLISVFSLGWNVYRDVVLKARVKMQFSLSKLHHPTFPKPIDSLILTATNMGPGKITFNMIQLRVVAPWWKRLFCRAKNAVMIPDYENPLSGMLPVKLDVGEKIDLLLKYKKDCFLDKDYTHIGLLDSFGRVHWASASEVKEAREKFRKFFEDNETKQRIA